MRHTTADPVAEATRTALADAPEGHPAAAEPGSKPARQDRSAGTAAKRRALTPAGPSRATMNLAG